MRALVPLFAVLGLAAWLVLRLGAGREGLGDGSATPAVGDADPASRPQVALLSAPVVEEATPDGSPARRAAVVARNEPVAGRVEVAGGRPLADQPVVVAHVHRTGVARLHSRRIEAPVARDGSFAFEVPAGTRSVSLELESLVLVLANEVEVLPGRRDVVLRPEVHAAVRGWAHRPGRLALGPSTCEEEPIHVSCGESRLDADPGGSFLFTVAVGTPLVIEAETTVGEPDSEPSRASARLALPALQPGEIREVDLFLEPWIGLRGVVLDTAGSPVAGAAVIVVPKGEQRLREGPDDFRTGSDGRFVLTPLPPDAWELRVRAAGRFSASKTLVLPREGYEELRFVLAAPALVRGRVLRPDGGPCAGARVLDVNSGPCFAGGPTNEGSRASGLQLIVDERWESTPESSFLPADADGRFAIEVDATRAKLTATGMSFAPSTPLGLELRPGQVMDGIVLWLRPGCRLRGRVLDEDGRPVLGSMRFASADGIEVLLFLHEGEFESSQLPPGRGRIEYPTEGTRGGLEGSLEFELDPERETVVELRLRGKRPW
ncbi:MAG: carboxypeptidase regulatory-like domain-containing protein [Planctomycetes bacterium]|nr:carboxypeptidase regulatory-like domain-containing protein [Planctomycetota bacterium]